MEEGRKPVGHEQAVGMALPEGKEAGQGIADHLAGGASKTSAGRAGSARRTATMSSTCSRSLLVRGLKRWLACIGRGAPARRRPVRPQVEALERRETPSVV